MFTHSFHKHSTLFLLYSFSKQYVTGAGVVNKVLGNYLQNKVLLRDDTSRGSFIKVLKFLQDIRLMLQETEELNKEQISTCTALETQLALCYILGLILPFIVYLRLLSNLNYKCFLRSFRYN